MTTYERLMSELADGLGADISPDESGITEVFAEGRVVTLRGDETGERELSAFTSVATAPEKGFDAATLSRALEMNLFGREVAGHHLGLFGDMLILSASIPLAGLTAEDLADRLVVLARLAGELSSSLGPDAPNMPEAEVAPSDGSYMAV